MHGFQEEVISSKTKVQVHLGGLSANIPTELKVNHGTWSKFNLDEIANGAKGIIKALQGGSFYGGIDANDLSIVQPPLLESEITPMLVETLKGSFYDRMTHHATKSFADMVVNGELILAAINSGRHFGDDTKKPYKKNDNEARETLFHTYPYNLCRVIPQLVESRLFDENAQCEYHDELKGHNIENCTAFKRVVEDLQKTGKKRRLKNMMMSLTASTTKKEDTRSNFFVHQCIRGVSDCKRWNKALTAEPTTIFGLICRTPLQQTTPIDSSLPFPLNHIREPLLTEPPSSSLPEEKNEAYQFLSPLNSCDRSSFCQIQMVSRQLQWRGLQLHLNAGVHFCSMGTISIMVVTKEKKEEKASSAVVALVRLDDYWNDDGYGFEK
ncbi:hypothetical protein GQ457_05G027600 [Hibiscus cannabinus]